MDRRSASDLNLVFYRRAGLTVFPLPPRSKKALIKEWQKKGREELFYEFSKYNSDCNIAVRLDGLTVLDIEQAELWDLFFYASLEEVAGHTWVSRTGGSGYHVYFRGETSPARADGFAEIRSGPGQYVVAPPSIHPSGRPYEWIANIMTTGMAPNDGLGKAREKNPYSSQIWSID